MSATAADLEGGATYEELSDIEYALELVDNETVAKQYLLTKPIFARRAAAVSRIQNYWALVFEQAPPEIDRSIQPTDSQVFASALVALDVDRPEIPKLAKPEATGIEHFGEPRSLSFRFEFAENEWFEDKVLEKTFYYRRCKDGWVGRVSDPVKIHWKKGKDLTDGLTDAAVALYEAQKKAGNQLDGVYAGQALKDRDAAAMKLPEYLKLKNLVEKSPEGAQSFFTWFAYRGRWVSAAESAEANNDVAERRKAGKPITPKQSLGDEEDLDEEDDLLDDGPEGEVEVFSFGEEVALALAEDLFPASNRYFIAAQEVDEEDISDAMDSEDFDDEDDEEGDEIAVEQIRNLVKRNNGSPQPPSKKQKR